MRVIRYKAGRDPVQYGWLHEGKVGPIQGDIFGKFKRMDAKIPVEGLRLLAPCTPGKIVCVGRNYIEHAKELGNEVPQVPLLFLKPPSAVLDPGESIVLPAQSQQVEHEAELVVVIGKRGRHITAEDARQHILGCTIGNDVTARDLQKTDSQWTRAKGFDTFCPIGPWIDTEFDASDAVITCRVNGQPRQMASTHDLVFPIPVLVAYISSVMTLEAGDLIFTGTPSGVGPLKAGDEVVVEIEGLGVLRNPVRAESG